MNKTFNVKESKCPSCGAVLGAATVVRGSESDTPDPGDLTICAYCFTYLQFNDVLQPVELSEPGFLRLSSDDKKLLKYLREALRKMNNE